MAASRTFGVIDPVTPDTYRKAQQLFLDALQVPDGERIEFVKRNGDSDEIVAEVFSLLRFNTNETLLPQTTTSLSDIGRPPDETVEFVSGEAPRLKQSHQAQPAIGLLDVEPADDLSTRFAHSTNHLLRRRLIEVALVLCGVLVVVTIMAAMFGALVPVRLAVRCFTLLLLGTCAWYLKHHTQLHRRTLRSIELVIVFFPLVELSLIQWFESSELLAEGEAIQLEELRAIVFSVAAIYIAIYGIFIPSPWRRTALITGAIALTPTAVSVLHQSLYEYPALVQWMHFANPTLIGVMACVATIGAGMVHQVRRQAESAKYYGQYELTEEIGRGAMGIVYLAKHQMLKRAAAIKLILAKDAGSPQAITQFEREVQASATLSHWNTVQIYDYGITEEGDFYCVMEYLKGDTLQRRICLKQTLTLQKTMSIVIQLCDGLEEAHHKGLIHRDIKPANVFLAEVGGFFDVVKLLDFGLVVSKAETEGDKKQLVGGTPAYMSPEQIRGDALDGRSDIYAIGCIMVECLTGFPPFKPLTITQLVSDHLFRVPELEPVAGIDARLPAILEKCLAKDRNNRFADVESLRAACRQFE